MYFEASEEIKTMEEAIASRTWKNQELLVILKCYFRGHAMP